MRVGGHDLGELTCEFMNLPIVRIIDAKDGQMRSAHRWSVISANVRSRRSEQWSNCGVGERAARFGYRAKHDGHPSCQAPLWNEALGDARIVIPPFHAQTGIRMGEASDFLLEK